MVVGRRLTCRPLGLTPLLLLMAGCGVAPGVHIIDDPPSHVVSVSLPVMVSAGADREVLAGDRVCLDGRGTYQPLGQSYSVIWERVAGEPVFLSNIADTAPCFVAPLTDQTLTFRLSADDGTWITTDTVTLRVRQRPERAAPLVLAGPDRYTTDGGPQVPGEADVLAVSDAGSEVRWEAVVPQPSAGVQETLGLAGGAVVYRVTATTADGMGSMPDYLVLWPPDGDAARVAPHSRLSSATTVAPAAPLLLDAAASFAASGDAIRWRWSQTCGEPTLFNPGDASRVGLTAPHRPQQLCFRVYARDNLLESAATEVRVEVTADGNMRAPQAMPLPSIKTHPNNPLSLDALATADSDITDGRASFTWLQTIGQQVTTSSLDAGQHLTFAAPPAAGTLAFRVYGSQDNIDGASRVAVVSVLDPNTNSEPTVTLCASTLTPASGETVTVTANVADPEGDALATPIWGNAPNGVVTPSPSTAVSAVPCGSLRPATYGSPVTAFGASFTAPAAGTPFVVTLTLCDHLNACGAASLSFH